LTPVARTSWLPELIEGYDPEQGYQIMGVVRCHITGYYGGSPGVRELGIYNAP